MQHYGTLADFPFRVPLYISAKSPREQILHKNPKYLSRPKDFNKDKDSSQNTGLIQAIIACTCPKVKSVQFFYSYGHIHHMQNTHEDNHLIDTQ